jgi:hypothetical protein
VRVVHLTLSVPVNHAAASLRFSEPGSALADAPSVQAGVSSLPGSHLA